jgi:uncharacterized membrane protein YadS
MTLNSLGLIPATASVAMADTSRWLLVLAIAGLGTKTSFGQLIEVGPTAAAIILVETAAVAVLAIMTLLW